MSTRHNHLVSVITPAYNAEKFIKQTMESVIAQTYPNWEMIIVDDCSTDKTIEYISEYVRKDERIKLIQLKENSGSAVARNTAIENAKGKYIAFLDSDDLWLPEKLEKQLHFMQQKNIAFSFTKYVRMTEDGQVKNSVSKAPSFVGYKDLLKHCVIGCLTVMVDKEEVGSLEMVNIRTRQDYALWLEITKRGYRAYGYPEVLAKYRLVHNSISSNKWKAAKRQWYVYRNVEKLSAIKSLWYFSHYALIGIWNTLQYKFAK